MNSNTLAELQVICDAATPGPWKGFSYKACGYGSVKAPDGGLCTFGLPIEILKGQYSRQGDDAIFIATFNPVMVKKLLAVVEAAKKQRSKDHPLHKAIAELKKNVEPLENRTEDPFWGEYGLGTALSDLAVF